MDHYDPKQIEPKWQAVWADEGSWEVSNEPDERPKAYVLEMLPYPCLLYTSPSPRDRS